MSDDVPWLNASIGTSPSWVSTVTWCVNSSTRLKRIGTPCVSSLAIRKNSSRSRT